MSTMLKQWKNSGFQDLPPPEQQQAQYIGLVGGRTRTPEENADPRFKDVETVPLAGDNPPQQTFSNNQEAHPVTKVEEAPAFADLASPERFATLVSGGFGGGDQ